MAVIPYTETKIALLQPGFTSALGALAPVAFTRALLMAPAPYGPVPDRLNRRRPLPDQMPEQAPHLRHGERQQPRGLHDGSFFPRWRAGARR
jgi:hypothetical protein